MFDTIQVSWETTRSSIVEQDSSLLVYHTPLSLTGRTELKEEGTVGNQGAFAAGTTPRSLIRLETNPIVLLLLFLNLK